MWDEDGRCRYVLDGVTKKHNGDGDWVLAELNKLSSAKARSPRSARDMHVIPKGMGACMAVIFTARHRGIGHATVTRIEAS